MKIKKLERETNRIILDLTEKEAKTFDIIAKRFCLSLRPNDAFFQEETLAKEFIEKFDSLQNKKT